MWNNGLVPNWERSMSRLYIVTLLIKLIWSAHHEKCWTGLLGEISITSDMQITLSLWQKAKRNWRVSWWSWKMKIMASSTNTSWQIDGETMETVGELILAGSKIPADGDSSHEIERWLLLRRKAIANLESILKSKGITLPTKVYIVKTMIFLVVMYEYEIWTTKKALGLRIDAFKLWC